MGAENVGRELIREAVCEVFSGSLGNADLKGVITFFDAGGSLRLREDSSSEDLLAQMKRVPGLLDAAALLGVGASDPVPLRAAAGEFVLEDAGRHVVRISRGRMKAPRALNTLTSVPSPSPPRRGITRMDLQGVRLLLLPAHDREVPVGRVEGILVLAWQEVQG